MMGIVFNVTFTLDPFTRLPVQAWEPTSTPFKATLIVAEVSVMDPRFFIVTTGVVGAQTVVDPLAGLTIFEICASLKLMAFTLMSSIYVLLPNAFVFRNFMIIF